MYMYVLTYDLPTTLGPLHYLYCNVLHSPLCCVHHNTYYTLGIILCTCYVFTQKHCSS